jgi:hypothetical protein
MSAASFTHPQVTGLDGVTRPWSETITARPGDRTSIANLCGYVVRATRFDGSTHTDVAEFTNASLYSGALTLANHIRSGRSKVAADYAVIDFVHNIDGRIVRSNG